MDKNALDGIYVDEILLNLKIKLNNFSAIMKLKS